MDNQQQPISAQTPSSPAPVLPGAGDLLSRALRVYRARFWTFLVIMLLPLVAVPVSLVPSIALKFISPIFSVLSLLVLYVVMIIFSLWSGVSLLYAIKEREAKIGVKDALKIGWHKIGSYWWVSILSAFIIMGGVLLFVIPGIIFSIWFGLGIYVLVAEDLKGINALFRSKQLVAGKWWSVFRRLIAMGLIIVVVSVLARISSTLFILFLGNTAGVLAGALIGWIVSFLLAPLPLIYAFLIYEDLKQLKAGAAFELPKRGTKIKYILIGLAGLLLIPAILAGIVLTSLNPAREAARDARRTADIRTLQTGLMLYYSENNLYPATLNELSGAYFLKGIPKDPKTNLSYEYKVQAGGQDFLICADFEKKEDQCLDSQGSWLPKKEVEDETADWKIWQDLVPAIQTVLIIAFEEAGIDTSPQVEIYKVGDITGDGIPEALVDIGLHGANTANYALMMIENGKPVLARFKEKDGLIPAFSENLFLLGGGVSIGFAVDFLPAEHAIFAGSSSRDFSTENYKCDTVVAYRWNVQEKLFEFDQGLSDKIKPDVCSRPEMND